MSNQETKIPTNHVVGIINGDVTAREAEEALRKAGFEETQIMTRVDAVGEGLNPISSLVERLAHHLSDDTGYLDQYQTATDQGSLIVSAKADEREDADRAAEILQFHGAVNIRYFGRLAIVDMTPTTNPSAPSDQVQ
jgi:hypothetical protein